VRGHVGSPLYVLTRPDIRNAEEIRDRMSFETIDGIVAARPGDVAITTRSGERYPILKHTFLGAYRIIGRVGPFIAAERLIHVRRAWPILSDDAVFDYGPDRGQVPAANGGWLYQSDDNDFGLISRQVTESSHTVIGPVSQLDSQKPHPQFARWSAALSWLPPLLALIALGAAFTAKEAQQWSAALIGINSALLLAGAGMMYWMKVDKWLLKGCVWSGVQLSKRFQTAVELLGQTPSMDFPGMSLWRAAQCDISSEAVSSNGVLIERLKAEIGTTLHELDRGIRRCRLHERITNVGTVVTFALILATNLYLLISHRTPKPGMYRELLEITAVWLPSLISAMHSFNVRRHTNERIVEMTEFSRALIFVRTRLFSGQPGQDAEGGLMRHIANLQLICRIVAQHSQRELLFALGGGPQLPM
jgi:hypothetical protein